MSLLFEPLDVVLGGKAKVRLLRTLTTTDGVSARSLARDAGITHMPALRALEELVAAGIVHRSFSGRQHTFTLNRSNELVKRVVVPAFEYEARRLHEVFQLITDQVTSIRDRILGVYLFGSAARGEDAPGSDFDVLIVTRSAKVNESVNERAPTLLEPLRSRYGLSPSVVTMSKAQLEELQRGKHSLAVQLKRDGRTVTGADLTEILR